LISEVLYNSYGYLVVIAGFLLLLAMISAISLTIDTVMREKKTKQLLVYKQPQRLNKKVTY